MTIRAVVFPAILGLIAPLAGCGDCHAPRGAIASSSATTAPTTQPPSAGTVAFKSTAAGMQFSYPTWWHPAKDDTVLTLVPQNEAAIGKRTLAIDKPDLPLHIPGLIPLNLVEAGFVDDLKKRYKQVDSVTSAALSIDGANGREIHASGVRDSGPAVVDAAVCVKGDAVYVIDGECDAAYKSQLDAAFEMVIGSIQWMD